MFTGEYELVRMDFTGGPSAREGDCPFYVDGHPGDRGRIKITKWSVTAGFSAQYLGVVTITRCDGRQEHFKISGIMWRESGELQNRFHATVLFLNEQDQSIVELIQDISGSGPSLREMLVQLMRDPLVIRQEPPYMDLQGEARKAGSLVRTMMDVLLEL